MKTTILLLTVFTAACGYVDPWPSEARVKSIYGAQVAGPECTLWFNSEVRLDGFALRDNVLLMRDILIREKVFRDEADFCAATQGLKYWVLELERWDCKTRDGHTDCTTGYYTVTDGIVLARYAEGLLHEVLHHVDALHLSPGTSWHEGWKTNGYYAMDHEYMNTNKDVFIGRD